MFDKLKSWVVEQVLWAETNMKGKTGKEKRQAVVDKLDALIPLPWFLEWMDGPLIGWLVDKACSILNDRRGHDWADTVDEAAKESIVEMLPDPAVPEKVMEAATSAATAAAASAISTAKAAEKAVTTAAASAVKAATKTTGGDLSAHFSKKEFACKCGCGLCNPAPKLIEKLEKFRALCGNKPMTINSACRCAKHNKAVGGASGSQHLVGKAADVRKVLGLTIEQMAKKAEEAGFTGIGMYKSFVHVDIRDKPARWDYRNK